MYTKKKCMLGNTVPIHQCYFFKRILLLHFNKIFLQYRKAYTNCHYREKYNNSEFHIPGHVYFVKEGKILTLFFYYTWTNYKQLVSKTIQHTTFTVILILQNSFFTLANSCWLLDHTVPSFY